MPAVFICSILQDGSIVGALLGLPRCKSESWRRYACTNVLLVCQREVGVLVQPGRT